MAHLAIRGGKAVVNGPRPSWPVMDDTEKQWLLDALMSREWGGFPEPMPRARMLGERFAGHQDARYGICCSNGSISLDIGLLAAGVKAGDEVIVPTLTWVATGAAPVHINAVPVFVDVDPGNYCMDPAAVEEAITDKTRAIIPVHLGSSIADMDRLMEIAAKRNLIVLEDCAHAHGSKWREKGVGSIGTLGSFSFQSSKILTSGEGGMIITSDDTLAQKCHSLVNCGRKEEGYDSFDGWLFGYNARMTEFQTGVMLAQLDRMVPLIERKHKALDYLLDGLSSVGGLSAIEPDPRETRRGLYQVIFKYDPEEFGGVHRDVFLQALEAEGVEMDGPFYVPMPMNPLFNARTDQWPMLRERYGDGIQSPETLRRFRFPNAAKAAYHEGCWLHYSYLLGEERDLDHIVEAVAKIKKHVDELE